jgi:hypothetical protein
VMAAGGMDKNVPEKKMIDFHDGRRVLGGG